MYLYISSGTKTREIMRNYWSACSQVSPLREFGSNATWVNSRYMDRLDEMGLCEW